MKYKRFESLVKEHHDLISDDDNETLKEFNQLVTSWIVSSGDKRKKIEYNLDDLFQRILSTEGATVLSKDEIEAKKNCTRIVKKKDMIKIGEAAKMFGKCTHTLRNWDCAGKLKAVRHPISGYRYYSKKVIEEIIAGYEKITPVD